MREIEYRGLVINALVSGEKWVASDEYYHEIYINKTEKRAYINSHEVVYESVSEYTGLKDKNGIKIFEGDIVKKNDNTGYNYEWLGSIIFKEGAFMIKFYKYGISYEYLNSKGKYNDSHSSFEYNIEFEVIGNVYENKDLLESIKTQ